MQVAETHFLGVEAEGVSAVLSSLEIDGYCRDVARYVFTHVDHSIVLAVLRDVNLGAVFPELQLGQLAAFTEADNGSVDNTVAMTEVEDKAFAVVVGCLGGEGHGFTIGFGDDKHTFHRGNAVLLGGFYVATVGIHDVEVAPVGDISRLSEGVAHEVPASEIDSGFKCQGDFFVFGVGRTSKDEIDAFAVVAAVGIETRCFGQCMKDPH